MITDILTIIWKEWKEIFAQYRNFDISLAIRIIALGVASVLPVLQAGEEWLTAPVVMMVAIWIPLLTVSDIVADTFAGERERHTLQTLLASRLSDFSILIGKVLSTGIYGWVNVILMLVFGLIAANIIDWGQGISFYSLSILIGSLINGLLISLATSLSGVVISIKATTVKKAQQNLGSAFFILVLCMYVVMKSIPMDWWRIPLGGSIWNLILFTALFLLFIDAILFIIAKKLFRREKLILD
ncbi:MAG: ABC transporter permease [Deltaproteobacteria bacterium]|nr:ABC transporter permease [Deltaproteobacteria bacterium]